MTALAGLAAFVVLVAGVGPARAHGQLLETDPVDGATLDSSPGEVVLTFSQEVAIAPGAVQVAEGSAAAVEAAPARHAAGRRHVVVADLPVLEPETYVVSWRVTSADGDPIIGSFSFVVRGPAGGAAEGSASASGGVPTPVAAGADRATSTPAATAGGGAYLAVTILRFAGFAAMVLLVGAGLHRLALSPDGAVAGRGDAAIVLSALVVAVTALLGIAVGAAHAAGRGVTAAADPDLLAPFLGTTAARAMLARAGVAAVVIAVVRAPLPLAVRRWLGLLTGLALVMTFVASGHAITGDHVPVAVVADLVHLAAAGVWIGGLASLLVIGGSRDPVVTRRFSSIAAWAVGALVVTGSFAVWRQVGPVERLVDTDYGRLVVAKLLLVAALLVLGAVSRRATRRALGPRLERSVAAEAGIAVVVLAVTAVLVGSAPGGSDGPMPGHAQDVLVVDRD